MGKSGSLASGLQGGTVCGFINVSRLAIEIVDWPFK
jgi:hypothetical protein